LGGCPAALDYEEKKWKKEKKKWCTDPWGQGKTERLFGPSVEGDG